MNKYFVAYVVTEEDNVHVHHHFGNVVMKVDGEITEEIVRKFEKEEAKRWSGVGVVVTFFHLLVA